jgi:hypothetical protein
VGVSRESGRLHNVFAAQKVWKSCESTFKKWIENPHKTKGFNFRCSSFFPDLCSGLHCTVFRFINDFVEMMAGADALFAMVFTKVLAGKMSKF